MQRLLIIFLIGCVSGGALLKIVERLPFKLAGPDVVLPDGGQYTGEMVDGVIEGAGTMHWPGGDRYTGSFKNGQFQGHGRLEFAGGAVYEGEFTNGAITGNGVLHYANGDRYTGVLKHGRANGKGTLDSAGNHYEGDFKDDSYYGAGKLTDKEGNIYTGGFEKGLFHGRGDYVTADGRRYEGDFVAGNFTGAGTFSSKEGLHYEGNFENWVFHGEGRLKDESGDQYIGRFERGYLVDEGEYIGKDGSHYQGGFDFGRYHGQGRLQTADGDVYAGEFEHGEYHGTGMLTYAKPLDNVTVVNGVWRNGHLIETGDKDKIMNSEALAELALYNQNELLRKSWKSLRDNDPEVIDMYFLGIAGDGTQAVFRREVLYVQEYFNRTFGVAGRSMALINDRSTVQEIPLATPTSIKQTLKELAKRMDPANDILFIFMASHGTKEFEFTLDQAGMNIPELPASTLAEMIAGLPVRWKVIVISACYAGGFIPALQDEHTLIITAASADRTSFGCSDRAEFTYFGEAYFRDALPVSRDFVEAFDKAMEIVSEREKTLKDEHSNPQIYKPASILEHLQLWRADLRAGTEISVKQTVH